MAEAVAQVATNDVLTSDGTLMDKLVGGLKAPFTSADAVTKELVVYSTVIYTILGVCAGIAMESRNVTVPLISKALRPKNRV